MKKFYSIFFFIKFYFFIKNHEESFIPAYIYSARLCIINIVWNIIKYKLIECYINNNLWLLIINIHWLIANSIVNEFNLAIYSYLQYAVLSVILSP